MTIEINVPIKCSTVKNIKTICARCIKTLITLFANLILPFGAIVFLMGIINLITGAYHDDTTSVCLSIGSVVMIFGYMVWEFTHPIKFKCIQDEVSPK